MVAKSVTAVTLSIEMHNVVLLQVESCGFFLTGPVQGAEADQNIEVDVLAGKGQPGTQFGTLNAKFLAWKLIRLVAGRC